MCVSLLLCWAWGPGFDIRRIPKKKTKSTLCAFFSCRACGKESARARILKNWMKMNEQWECWTLCATKTKEACLYGGREAKTRVTTACPRHLCCTAHKKNVISPGFLHTSTSGSTSTCLFFLYNISPLYHNFSYTFDPKMHHYHNFSYTFDPKMHHPAMDS